MALERRRRSWGAEIDRRGGGSFRLWAPKLDALSLRLAGSDLPMNKGAEGWFELEVADLRPGTAYAYLLPDGQVLADPAAHAQRDTVHGPSLVVDHASHVWQDEHWRGRPWREAVVYELHVGTFTPEGTFAAAAERLTHLRDLGVTALELMPVAHFAGRRGWGYDGVLPYAPHPAYGSPDDLRRLVDAAHRHELMILLDVVYNHFGPEGNYLATYAPDFFHPERHTPWGAAIAYEKPAVRRFFIDNALHWLEDYRFDGLRLDAIDHVRDTLSQTDILAELAAEVRRELPDREIHLTSEDNRNIVGLHPYGEDGRPKLYTAEWNDDLHNAAHVIATGETDGYYRDFGPQRLAKFARALAEGFAYQGEAPAHGGAPRGEPSSGQPTVAFVDFLQNHDQIGNRAFGERLTDLAAGEMVRALTSILLLSPHIPLLFMGEEWGERRPFSFFTDFEGELADAVREGRRREFADFAAFGHNAEALGHIPDPNAISTFETSRIDWNAPQSEEGAAWMHLYRDLLAKRRRHVVPLLGGRAEGKVLSAEEGSVAIDWVFASGRLELRANLSAEPQDMPPVRGAVFHGAYVDGDGAEGELAPFAVLFAGEIDER